MLTTLSLTILTVFSFASIAMLLSRIASKRISFFQFFAMSNSLAATHGVKEIRLVANGQGVIPAALAALYFKDCPVTVKWIDPPPSFESLMRLDVVPLPFSNLIPSILKYLDLPELFEKLKD